MAFQELLNQVGGLGRFQILQIAFVFFLQGLVMSQIIMENFTATIPSHRCWVPILDNDTVSNNDSRMLSQDDLLRISIPLDSNLRLNKCRRFAQPQWHFLRLNGTFSSVTEPDTEPCIDGWVYNKSNFLSTTVTEVVRTRMKKELEAAKTKHSPRDLLHIPILRKRICILSFMRLLFTLSTTGLAIHLPHLTANVILVQFLTSVVSILFSVVGHLVLNQLGRKITQMVILPLRGIFILSAAFVPQEMQTPRVIMATLGGAIGPLCLSVFRLHTNELLPTTLRGTGIGVIGMFGNIGLFLSPLIMMLAPYSANLPWIFYGGLSILNGFSAYFLPETKNRPLPDSIYDIANDWKESRQAKKEDPIIKVTRF